MPAQSYIDIFEAKDRVTRILRETGVQPYSRLLMSSQLPEDVLGKVLDLLVNENKIKVNPAPRNQAESAQTETTFQPVSGVWPFSVLGR